MGVDPSRSGDSSARALSRQAAELVSSLAEAWDHRGNRLGNLLDRACTRLSEQANHELRQIFTLVTTELELARRRAPDGEPVRIDQETLSRLLESLQRGTEIIATYLDRNEAAKLLIQLNPEPVELADLCRASLAGEGLDPEQDKLDLETERIQIHADRDKLGAVIGYLAGELAHARPPEGHVVARIKAEASGARGFVGLDPSPLSRRELIEKLEANLDIQEIGIDLPYARAVIERHGGSLYVEDRNGALGYGFQIPASPTVEGIA